MRSLEKRRREGEEQIIEEKKEEQMESEETRPELMEDEIEKQIGNLKEKKTEGNTRGKLKELAKKLWGREGFPEDWRKASIVRVHKKGDTEVSENYQDISLLSAAYNIFAATLNERQADKRTGSGNRF
ncbi:uncharacterized protein LOC143260963 [Megalopta genalis]|uniref:uncharacterized protein LOC143259345 n=1 Tax=Megalopta genalis TaxID=115081 RepID=UPI003FD30098